MTGAGSYNWPGTGIVYIKVIEQKLKHALSNRKLRKDAAVEKLVGGENLQTYIVPELSNTIKARDLKSASFT